MPTNVDKELAAAEALVASLKKKKELDGAAAKFAKDHGFDSLQKLVAFLHPPAVVKAVKGRGRPPGSTGKRTKKTPQLVAKIKALRKAGKTYQEIKAATGVGLNSIPVWLKG